MTWCIFYCSCFRSHIFVFVYIIIFYSLYSAWIWARACYLPRGTPTWVSDLPHAYGKLILYTSLAMVIGRSNSIEILTHWGRVTHICVSRLTITGSDNGLSPGRRQAIIWTNAGILSTGPLGTNFIENLFKILPFPFTKMRLKVSSVKWRPFCLGLNVLTWCYGHCVYTAMQYVRSIM